MKPRSPDQEVHHLALMAALVAARRKAGISQRQLAAKLTRAHSFVAKIEGGTRQLKVVELFEYTQALDIDPAALLSQMAAGSGEPDVPAGALRSDDQPEPRREEPAPLGRWRC